MVTAGKRRRAAAASLVQLSLEGQVELRLQRELFEPALGFYLERDTAQLHPLTVLDEEYLELSLARHQRQFAPAINEFAGGDLAKKCGQVGRVVDERQRAVGRSDQPIETNAQFFAGCNPGIGEVCRPHFQCSGSS